MPGAPLLILHGNCPTLEKPSDMTQEVIEKASDQRILSTFQEETIKNLKTQIFGEELPRKKKKRKGPKGPNPLSCKKKKPKTNSDIHGVKNKMESEGKKRKRRKNKQKLLI